MFCSQPDVGNSQQQVLYQHVSLVALHNNSNHALPQLQQQHQQQLQNQYIPNRPVDRAASLIIQPTYSTPDLQAHFPGGLELRHHPVRAAYAHRPNSTPDLAARQGLVPQTRSPDLISRKNTQNSNLEAVSRLDQSMDNLALHNPHRLEVFQPNHLSSANQLNLQKSVPLYENLPHPAANPMTSELALDSTQRRRLPDPPQQTTTPELLRHRISSNNQANNVLRKSVDLNRSSSYVGTVNPGFSEVDPSYDVIRTSVELSPQHEMASTNLKVSEKELDDSVIENTSVTSQDSCKRLSRHSEDDGEVRDIVCISYNVMHEPGLLTGLKPKAACF